MKICSGNEHVVENHQPLAAVLRIASVDIRALHAAAVTGLLPIDKLMPAASTAGAGDGKIAVCFSHLRMASPAGSELMQPVWGALAPVMYTPSSLPRDARLVTSCRCGALAIALHIGHGALMT
jgi:hypothetical protein